MRARAVAAVVVAVYCGLLLGGLAARIAWSIGERPIDASLAEPALVVSGTAFVSEVHEREASPAPSEEGWSGALPAPNHRTYHWQNVNTWPIILDTIHERLAQAGWQLGDRVGDDIRKVFWAARDGHLLRVLGGLDRNVPTVILQLYRTEPPGVLPAAIGGLLLGGAATWFAARWILRRKGVPGWARFMGGVAVVFAGILSTLTVVVFLLTGIAGWWTTHDLQLPVLVFTGFPEAGIGTLLALTGYTALATRRGTAAVTPAESVPSS